MINVGAGNRLWCNVQANMDRLYSYEAPPHYKVPPSKNGRSFECKKENLLCSDKNNVLKLGNYQIFCGRRNAKMATIIRSA